MFHLIVPPIIVVFAVAVLVIFLAKNISSDADGGSFALRRDKKRPKTSKLNLQLNFSEKKKESVLRVGKAIKNRKKVKKEDLVMPDKESVFESLKEKGALKGIAKKKNTKEKVVLLRKKSMVSDKIENSEGRDSEEVRLMNEIEKKPQDSKGYEKLGDYYMEHENFEDARDCYKYVLRLDPHHKRAQVAMKNLDRVL
ncbi:MAG: hypothetical protein CR972_00180 [Candidatus Moraniibacteriota bacterium]|nr:MAG: hypothetical protein CR972_00180 [Candidatus Moranbacteria bacterium]